VVDTTLLRKQLMAERDAIDERLRAIDLVEGIVAATGTAGSRSGGRITLRPAGVSKAVGEANATSMSEYTRSMLSMEWRSADEIVAGVRAKYPDSSRQGVLTALRRWVDRKVAEPKGSKSKGFSFRLRRYVEVEEGDGRGGGPGPIVAA
jgi:hypothetical protein